MNKWYLFANTASALTARLTDGKSAQTLIGLSVQLPAPRQKRQSLPASTCHLSVVISDGICRPSESSLHKVEPVAMESTPNGGLLHRSYLSQEFDSVCVFSARLIAYRSNARCARSVARVKAYRVGGRMKAVQSGTLHKSPSGLIHLARPAGRQLVANEL